MNKIEKMKIFLFGEEDFFVVKNALILRESFVKNNPTARVDVVDFEEAFEKKEIATIFSQGSGLFARKTLFVGKNIFSLNAEKLNDFLDILKQSPKDMEIILTHQGSIAKHRRTRLWKFVEKDFEKKEFGKFQLGDVSSWMMSEIEKRTKGQLKINKNWAMKLAVSYEGNLWKLDGEIEKIINFYDYGNQNSKEIIAGEEIENICDLKINSNVFELIDAIGQRNKKKALDVLSRLLKSGENVFAIFSMMVFQMRNMAKVYDLKNQPAILVAKKMKMHPFVVQKTQKQLASFDKKEIREIYERLADFDYGMKTGGLTGEKALFDLVVKL